MNSKEMFELFQGLDDFDKRGFFVFMSKRYDSFPTYFKEYLDMADDINESVTKTCVPCNSIFFEDICEFCNDRDAEYILLAVFRNYGEYKLKSEK